ncbi:MAG: PIN domain-containing protein [Bifidobacteriaceae bacterium]|jgi:predicted nucleic acid-binding protein|nr:PIN domain-containing protein [Bifidobacteriaceae bacterium]
MLVVDANVLIALANPNHVHHEAAAAVLDRDGELAIPALTLAEVMVLPAAAGELDSAMAQVDALGVVAYPLEVSDVRRLAALRAETRLRMPDAVVLLLTLRHGATLATFDERLARVARDLGVAVEP